MYTLVGASRKNELHTLRIEFDAAGDFARAYQRDPNLGGIEVGIKSERAVGSRLLLNIETAGTLVSIEAEVIRCTPEKTQPHVYRLALRFIDPSPAQKALCAPIQPLARIAPKPSSSEASQFAVSHTYMNEESGDILDLSLSTDTDDMVIGIDLGTSNSCACVMLEGKPRIIALHDQEGAPLGVRSVPSVVRYDGARNISVGHAALHGILDSPRSTIYGAKRFIGRPFDSLPVQRMLNKFPYRLIAGRNGKVAVDIEGDAVSLANISGRVLKAVRDKVNAKLGTNISRAVITVPAYYSDNQRQAVVNAARLAGLSVDRILNEPTAAAIAYGVVRAHDRTLLVYDLGGGTFDVSVMKIHRGDLRVLSTAGDTFLGGDDFDNAIVDYVYEIFHHQTDKRLSQNFNARARLKRVAEQAKVRLSDRQSTMFSLREIDLFGGGTTRLEIELRRKDIERLMRPFILRSLRCCAQAMKEAGVKKTDLAEILLVGGQTRMPLVRRLVTEYFAREVRSELNPDEAVALGAGILAYLPKESGIVFQDVLPMTIGLGLHGTFRPLIARNTALPTLKQVEFNVEQKDFDHFQLELWQGDNPELHRNELLGSMPANAVEPGSSDPVPLRADFSLSPDGILRVTLNNLATGETQHVLLNTQDEAL